MKVMLSTFLQQPLQVAQPLRVAHVHDLALVLDREEVALTAERVPRRGGRRRRRDPAERLDQRLDIREPRAGVSALGEAANDVDLATTALPAETIRRGRKAGFKAVPTGIEHGTVTLVSGRASFEVTTLRRDVETDGRRAKVVFGRDFAADALRRDFTINALGLDRSGALHDYSDGLADLAQRRVRFIGQAEARIRSQVPDEERRAMADVVIDAGGTLEHTLEQVDALWERLVAQRAVGGRS